MKILSIDVGMKNLAYCLLNYEDDYTIEKWDIIDLCENTTHICKGKLKNGERWRWYFIFFCVCFTIEFIFLCIFPYF